MTQCDLFGNEKPQHRLWVQLIDQRLENEGDVVRMEVWSNPLGHQARLLGILHYRETAQDLLVEDQQYIVDAWRWDTVRNIVRWLTRRQRYLTKYTREHPVSGDPTPL